MAPAAKCRLPRRAGHLELQLLRFQENCSNLPSIPVDSTESPLWPQGTLSILSTSANFQSQLPISRLGPKELDQNTQNSTSCAQNCSTGREPITRGELSRFSGPNRRLRNNPGGCQQFPPGSRCHVTLGGSSQLCATSDGCMRSTAVTPFLRLPPPGPGAPNLRSPPPAAAREAAGCAPLCRARRAVRSDSPGRFRPRLAAPSLAVQ